MSVTVTVCVTCKFAPGQAVDAQGRSGGARLAEALETACGNQTGTPRIIRHDCLWACSQSCVVLIRSEGRTGYLAGRFAPDADAADAILDWATAYGRSATGEVAYADWPEGIKGHFIARLPQLEGF